MIRNVITILGTVATSLLLTRLMITLGARFGLMDQPSDRRIHKTPVPRAGGIAIYLTVVIWIGILILTRPADGQLIKDGLVFICGGGAILLVGVWDDWRGMRPIIKLAFQTAVAVGLAMNGHSAQLILNRIPAVDMAIQVAWIVGLMNAFNLIDGLDGLCAGLALIALTSMLILGASLGHVQGLSLTLLMIGAVAGFLRYNYHPARIFLGDAGAMLIGFFIAWMATRLFGHRTVIATLLVPLIVAGVPLLDVLLALWRRSVRQLIAPVRGHIFTADKDHLHHRLLRTGLNQHRVAMTLYGCAIVLAIIALQPFMFGFQTTILSVLALMAAALYGLRQFATVEMKCSTEWHYIRLQRASAVKSSLLTLFLVDAVLLLGARLAAVALDTADYHAVLTLDALSYEAAISVAAGLIGLALSKAHVRIWHNASVRDCASIMWNLGLSQLFAFGLITLSHQDLSWQDLRITLLTLSLAGPAIMIPRLAFPLLRSLHIDELSRPKTDEETKRRVLIYGAGPMGELYAESLSYNTASTEKLTVCGFLDENTSLHGRWMRGFRVLGGLTHLEGLIRTQGINELIITTAEVDAKTELELAALTASTNLRVLHWRNHLSIWEPAAKPDPTAPVPDPDYIKS